MNPVSPFDLISTSLCNPNPYPSPLSFFDLHLEEDSPVAFALNLLNPSPSPFDLLPTTFDLIQIPSAFGIRTPQQRSDTGGCLRSLSDRVAALEIGLNRALTPSDLDRKYKWTTEIKGGEVDRKYTWTTELKAGEEKKCKWTAEIKGKGRDGDRSRTCSFEASTAPKGKMMNKKKVGREKKNIKKVKDVGVKLSEIEQKNPGTVAIRKV